MFTKTFTCGHTIDFFEDGSAKCSMSPVDILRNKLIDSHCVCEAFANNYDNYEIYYSNLRDNEGKALYHVTKRFNQLMRFFRTQEGFDEDLSRLCFGEVIEFPSTYNKNTILFSGGILKELDIVLKPYRIRGKKIFYNVIKYLEEYVSKMGFVFWRLDGYAKGCFRNDLERDRRRWRTGFSNGVGIGLGKYFYSPTYGRVSLDSIKVNCFNTQHERVNIILRLLNIVLAGRYDYEVTNVLREVELLYDHSRSEYQRFVCMRNRNYSQCVYPVSTLTGGKNG